MPIDALIGFDWLPNDTASEVSNCQCACSWEIPVKQICDVIDFCVVVIKFSPLPQQIDFFFQLSKCQNESVAIEMG